MKAVVLVGGEGSRLRPLTYKVPKPLLPIAEVPLIERVLGPLRGVGIDEVVFSMGYQPDAFRAAYPDGECLGLPVRYVVEATPLDTGGGIAFAARASGVEETFLALNSDVICDFDLARLIEAHERSRAEATIALTPIDEPADFGVVVTAANGRVTEFVEKPAGKPRSNRINAGIYVLSPDILERLPEDKPVHIETETFVEMVDEGVLWSVTYDGWWIDVGNRARYITANVDAVARGHAASGAAEISSGVWAMPMACIQGEVEGPSLVGAGAIVEAGARVCGSVVSAGVRIRSGAAVDGSVVLAGATVSAGAVVEASVIGPGEVVPARRVTREVVADSAGRGGGPATARRAGWGARPGREH